MPNCGGAQIAKKVLSWDGRARLLLSGLRIWAGMDPHVGRSLHSADAR
jgi:hypothetical protein